MTALYGLIGYPITHSFSPAYFKKKFAALGVDAVYEAFPLAGIHEFPHLLLTHSGIEGLNITIPYKTAIIPFLHDIDGVAASIGAVNCITIRNGKIKGYNTDAEGFEKSLNPLLQSQHTQSLILGTGASSKTVAYVLKELGINYKKVSRRPGAGDLSYGDLSPNIMAQHKLIINTTPSGLYPNIDAAPPLPYDSITDRHLLYDLIYNPDETKFLAYGKAKGATTKNGFEMLQLQADASWEIWCDHR